MSQQEQPATDTRKRFPRIHHVVNGPLRGGGVTRDDIVLSPKDTSSFLDLSVGLTPRQRTCWSIVVQEKIDGANLGIFYDPESRSLAMQNRSHRVVVNSGSQWKGLERFVEEVGPEILGLLFELPKIPQLQQLVNASSAASTTTISTTDSASAAAKASSDDNDDSDVNNTTHTERDINQAEVAEEEERRAGEWTLYGEWVLARHSVAYDRLPSPFLAFDIHHAPSDTFLATEVVRRLLAKHCPSIHMVPLLKEWRAAAAAAPPPQLPPTVAGNNNNINMMMMVNNTTTTQQQQPPAVVVGHVPTWAEIHEAYHSKPSCFGGGLGGGLGGGSSNTGCCCEGAMVRLDACGALVRRCKAVHDEFRSGIEEGGHWTSKTMVKNGILAFDE